MIILKYRDKNRNYDNRNSTIALIQYYTASWVEFVGVAGVNY